MQGKHLKKQIKECYRRWLIWGYLWSILSVGFIWSIIHPWSWEVSLILGCLGGGFTYRYWVKSFSPWLVWFDRHSSEPYLIESAWEAHQKDHLFASALTVKALHLLAQHPKRYPIWPVKPFLALCLVTCLTFTPPSQTLFSLDIFSSQISELTALFTSSKVQSNGLQDVSSKDNTKKLKSEKSKTLKRSSSSNQSPKITTSLHLDSESSASFRKPPSPSLDSAKLSTDLLPPSPPLSSKTSDLIRISQRQSQAGLQASQSKELQSDLEVREYTLKTSSLSPPTHPSQFQMLQSSIQPQSPLSPLKKIAPPLTPHHFSVRIQPYLRLSKSP